MKIEKKSIKQLKDQCWKLCSEYIRKREDKCFTCLSTESNCQAGHFIHGHTKLTFFEPDNIHRQCRRCNLYLSGNEVEYTLRMIKKYGLERVEELHKLSKNGKVHTRQDIIKWIKYYQDKIKELSL